MTTTPKAHPNRRALRRAARLCRLVALGAPELLIDNEVRMLKEALAEPEPKRRHLELVRLYARHEAELPEHSDYEHLDEAPENPELWDFETRSRELTEEEDAEQREALDELEREEERIEWAALSGGPYGPEEV